MSDLEPFAAFLQGAAVGGVAVGSLVNVHGTPALLVASLVGFVAMTLAYAIEKGGAT